MTLAILFSVQLVLVSAAIVLGYASTRTFPHQGPTVNDFAVLVVAMVLIFAAIDVTLARG